MIYRGASIVANVFRFIDKLLNEEKDSAKPLSYIASIYRNVLIFFGVDSDLLSNKHKSVKAMQRALENPLLAAKSRVRMIHVELAYVVQCRLLLNQARLDPFTELHSQLYDDLLKLATSRYDDVSLTCTRMQY